MTFDMNVYYVELEDGPLCSFQDWPNDDIPQVAAGVYTVWLGDQLVYVGMAGRGLSKDDVSQRSNEGSRAGLYNRLSAHASGARSGDQFCVYVCDRFVLPALTREDIDRVARGELSLDSHTREFIRGRLTYRFVVTEDGRSALDLEAAVKAGVLRAGKPLLNS